ncbi:hypothetical protein KI387_031315, partial [Taxus chinensis]
IHLDKKGTNGSWSRWWTVVMRQLHFGQQINLTTALPVLRSFSSGLGKLAQTSRFSSHVGQHIVPVGA